MLLALVGALHHPSLEGVLLVPVNPSLTLLRFPSHWFWVVGTFVVDTEFQPWARRGLPSSVCDTSAGPELPGLCTHRILLHGS